MEDDAPANLPAIPARDDASQFHDFSRGDRFVSLLPSIGVNVVGQRIVDLGAGYGSISIAASRRGAESVTALDANPNRLRVLSSRAAALGAKVRTLNANLLDPLPLEPVDLALLIGVVEYAGLWDHDRPVRDLQRQLFARAYDALTPAGALVVGTKNRLWPRFVIDDPHTRQPLVNVLPRRWADGVSRRFAGEPYRHHIHSPRGWERLLREAGFTTLTRYYPYFSYQLPVSIVSSPQLSDIRGLSRLPLVQEEARAAMGPRWVPKVAVMSATGLGVPLTQSVVIVARR